MAVPKTLYRNSEKKYAEAFVEEGEILFRPLSYFRVLEDVARADPMEAKFTGSASGACISVDINEDGKHIPFFTLNTGHVTLESKQADQIHVSCFSLQPQMKFGDSTIEIFEPAEFLDQLSVAFSDANTTLRFGSVSYYDSADKFRGLPETQIWLLKRKQYEAEAEFRISIFVNDRAEMYRRNFTTEIPVENGLVAPRIKVRVGPLKRFARLV
jgi:hypothetical protein